MKVFSTGLFVILFAAAIAAAATEAPGFSFSGDTEFFCGSAVPARNSAPVVLPPHDGPVTVDISIAGFAFTPDNLTINVGDTVRWTNNDGRSHTTTSDSLVWDSGGLSPADTFSFTFNDAGVFPYHCNIHTFMTASITVQGGASPTPTPSGSLVINEIDYDQPNMDAAEFIELKNVSGGMINLDPVVVELINGAACCTPYATIDLPNVDLAPGAYYVICGNAAAVPNCDLDVTPDTNLIQNGAPDAIGLRISGTLVDTVSYEGDTGAPYTEGSGVGLIDDGVATDSGISRFPDGQDTGVNNVDLSQRCVTPGSANSPAMCNGSPTPTGTATITSTPTATATATNTPTSTPTPAETPSVSGVITYGNAIGSPAPPRFVKNVSVAGTGMPLVGPVLTGLNGEYTLIGFGSGPYTILPTKPSGPNTAVTSNDAARVAQGVSGSVPFISNNQRYSSDASGNGTISSNDAALIARFAAGLTGFGNTGQWKFFCPPGPNWPPPGPTQTCNSFPSVNGPITGVDMIALLVGEASGNYNPATHPRGTVESGKWKVESEEGDLEKPITIAAQPVMAGADKEIVVPVSVEGAAGKDVISYEFNVRYDPSVIRPMGDPVDVLGTVSRGLLVVTNPFEPGLLRVVVYGPMPIDEDGVLLNLRFTAVGKAGSVSPLTFERVMFNEGEPRVLVSDGRVGLF